MNSVQLETAMLNDPYLKIVYGGILPVDLFFNLKSIVKASAYIVNTDDSNGEGEHWVAIYFDKQSSFFDSYGREPSYVLKNVLYDYEYNDKMLQSPYSEVCGHYCLYFLYHKVRGYVNIFKEFDEDVVNNDKIVKTYVEANFVY